MHKMCNVKIVANVAKKTKKWPIASEMKSIIPTPATNDSHLGSLHIIAPITRPFTWLWPVVKQQRCGIFNKTISAFAKKIQSWVLRTNTCSKYFSKTWPWYFYDKYKIWSFAKQKPSFKHEQTWFLIMSKPGMSVQINMWNGLWPLHQYGIECLLNSEKFRNLYCAVSAQRKDLNGLRLLLFLLSAGHCGCPLLSHPRLTTVAAGLWLCIHLPPVYRRI